MKLILSFLAQSVRPRPDGHMDAQTIITELAAPGFPAEQPRVVLVLVMEWEHGEHGNQSYRISLVDDAGNVVGAIEESVDVPELKPDDPLYHTKLPLHIDRLVFPHAGAYHFEVTAGGDVHQACGLYVQKQVEAERTPPAGPGY